MAACQPVRAAASDPKSYRIVDNDTIRIMAIAPRRIERTVSRESRLSALKIEIVGDELVSAVNTQTRLLSV